MGGPVRVPDRGRSAVRVLAEEPTHQAGRLEDERLLSRASLSEEAPPAIGEDLRVIAAVPESVPGPSYNDER